MSDEKVLGVPLSRLESLGLFTGMTTDVPRYHPALLEREHLSFRPRSECEIDPTWLQLIPYIVLENGGRLFHYTRGAKGGETRLHALKSIGIGGHINDVDATRSDSYRAGLEREYAEEVSAAAPINEKILGLLYDPSTPVGRVHLGIVHLFTLPSDKVTPRDASLTEWGFASVRDLQRESGQFESWSRLVLECLAERR